MNEGHDDNRKTLLVIEYNKVRDFYSVYGKQEGSGNR